MFQAIQRADYETLRALAKAFIETKNDLAAVLCLDHVFSRPFELQGLTIFEAQESLSSYLGYIRLLTKFLDESVLENLDKQKLFGFQALGEDRWLVPRHTILHKGCTGKYNPSGRGEDGYIWGYDELRRGIKAVIENRISTRTWIEDRACRGVHGFSPCLRFLVQGECNPLCTSQHILPQRATIDWYHARLRLILLQLEILHTASHTSPDTVTYVGFVMRTVSVDTH